MKTIRYSAMTAILAVLIVTACHKYADKSSAETGNVTEMKDLVIPENFKWEMSGLYTFIVKGNENQLIEIKTADGSGLLHKCIMEKGRTESIITLRLPTFMTAVLVNNQKVSLGAGIISVSINSLKSILSSDNKALNFDGTDDDAKIGNYPEHSPGTGPFTCEAWVKTNDRSSDTWGRKIVSKGMEYGMYIDPVTGQLRGYIDNNSTLPGMTFIDDGNWHHVALVRNGSNIKLFVDGVAEREDINPLYSVNLNSSDPFEIGSTQIGSDNHGHWNGKIDEVRYWKVKRTTAEIHANYNIKVSYSHPDLNGAWDCDEDTPVPGYVKDRTAHGHDGELEHGCSPIPCPIPAMDSDGDGVADVSDDYPYDPARAFDNYFPATGEGTLAFEDLWPSKGDYDCNDLVLGYRFKTVTNASNKVVEVIGTFNVRAVGAALDNGFGFQLPGASAPLLTNLHVSGYELSGSLVTLDATTHLETGQTKPVVILFDNAHFFMPGLSNTIVGNPYITPHTLTLTMSVPANTYTAADISLNTWNPFLIISQDRGREVHLIDHVPTGLANLSYLGTQEDASIPSSGIYYRTGNRLPWVLDFPVSFDYPIEYHPINIAYLHFVEWAESGGTLMTDWYSNLGAGYRDNTYIYTH